MKILFVTHYSTLYGANLSMCGLIEDLRNRYGCEITVLIPFSGELTERLMDLGIQYIVSSFYQWEQLKINKLMPRIKNQIKKILNHYLFYKAYKKLSKDFDIVHSNSSVIHIGDYIANKFKVPHIWHLREYGSVDYNLEYIYSQKYVEKRYSRAASCIAISNDILSFYQKLFPTCGFSKIYNGIAECKEVKRFVKDNSETVCFCCVGLICEGKRQLDILKAAQKLIEVGPLNFHITFIGTGDEKYLEELNSFINKYEMQKYVSFLGHQKDVLSIIQNEDVGIITSKREAFGRVTVEYMFSSMPVIGAASGGTIEIVQDGVTGLLFEPENVDDLYSKMKYFIENKQKIVEFGKKGRERAHNCFSIDKNTDAVMELYKKVLHLV